MINWVDNKLATIKSFKADVFSVNPLSEKMMRGLSAQNVSFETLYSSQFTLKSTQLIIPNYLVNQQIGLAICIPSKGVALTLFVSCYRNLDML